ncbi:LysE family translocator [Mesorhizobium retamae]|uniref:LysE family translocator n=1 Tax=Mesorhizobium retamae TaxID=2912854 RepID=UPI0031BA8EF5
MTLADFLAYSTAVVLAAMTPGPAMFAVITNGVSRGFARAFTAGLGVAAGDAVLVTMALLGLVTLVQTFEWIFLVLKYAGAAYLIYLGVKMWRSAAAQAEDGGKGEVRPLLRAWRVDRTRQSQGDPVSRLDHAVDPGSQRDDLR